MKHDIILNMVKCGLCKQVLLSLHRHDFRQCSCGNTFVDGGRDYLRRGGKYIGDIQELSVVRLNNELRLVTDLDPEQTIGTDDDSE